MTTKQFLYFSCNSFIKIDLREIRYSSYECSVLLWLKDTNPVEEDQLSSLFVTFADFENALEIVHPSAKREGFATVPDVTWSDIGALTEVREELLWSILARFLVSHHCSVISFSGSCSLKNI